MFATDIYIFFQVQMKTLAKNLKWQIYQFKDIYFFT
jgi:hypothetical protein